MQASDLKNLNIAIVGAGYGGAAAGKALSLLGANVQVYEQATSDPRGRRRHRPAPVHAWTGSAQWGIFDAIAEVSSPSDYFEILTATGDQIIRRRRGRRSTTTAWRTRPT